MTKTRRSLCGTVLILLLTMVAYIPALHCGFIWDDDDHFTRNPAMNSVHGLEQIWSSLAVSRYYPLTLTTFWIERHLWGLHPQPYHAVNIALQAVNAVLLWTLLRRLKVPGAWFAAALWAVHPVNVESVAWVTELKNIQSGFFFFLSVLYFLKFENDNQRGSYALALGFGVAAMLSKPSTVVLPPVLLLCTWWEHGRWQRRDLLRVTPFFGLALAMSAMTVVEQQRWVQRAGTVGWRLAPAERLVIAGKTVWFYAAHLLWPVNLMFVYPRWNVSVDSALPWLPLASAIASGALLWTHRRKPWARAALFGVGFFVVALLPVMGFFTVYYFRYSFVADHFQYLASIGLIGLVVSGGTSVCQRAGQAYRDVGVVVAAIALLALGAATWKRTQVYQNPETLWQDTVNRNPAAYMAQNNLGVALLQTGRVQEAMAQFEQTIRLKPDDAEAYINLGNALMQTGKLREAIAQYEQALHLNPNFPVAHKRLGLALERTGDMTEAAWHYQEALRFKPDDAEAQNYLGHTSEKTGKMPEAVWHYEEALRVKPDYPEALNNLAWLLATRLPAESNNAVRAVALAGQACELTDNRIATYVDTLAAAYASTGRFNEAIASAQKAIELARAATQPQLVAKIEARLDLYRTGHPYFDSATVTNQP